MWVVLARAVDGNEEEPATAVVAASDINLSTEKDFTTHLHVKRNPVQFTWPLAQIGWANIPRDCLERVIIVGNIFGTKSLTNIGGVCRNWRIIVNQDSIWKKVMEIFF